MAQTSDRRTFSALRIVPLLAGLLLALGIMPITFGGYLGARNNTSQLLNSNRDAILDSLEEQMRATFESVALQAQLVARHLERPTVNPSDAAAINGFMLGAATSQENIESLGYIEATGPLRRWPRGGNGYDVVDRSLVREVEQMWSDVQISRKGSWTTPFISLITGRVLVVYRQPVFRGNSVSGTLLAVVAADSKSSQFMSQSMPLTPFVLYGRDKVVIHANMRNAEFKEQALPDLADVGDPYLAMMWRDPRRTALGESGRSRLHWTWTGEGYGARIYAYREILDFGPEPLIIGYHQDSLQTFQVRWTVQALFYGAILTIVLGLGITWWLTRRAIRPAAEIAEAARALEKLDFAGVSGHLIRNSRIKEVRDTSQALASAARALDRFQTYVPRTLVRQVMGTQAVDTTAADREVSVLFMDLAGYTRYSEGRQATDVGAYLNRLFGRIGPIIEGNGGTIDKYTGDGLLAVWGAPTPDPDHATSAWRTVLALKEELSAWVAEELAIDPDACRVRLGLHSGRVLAGDVGFEGRMDYTVIGRTVNIAQRSQAALKGYMDDATVGIAVTESTRLLLNLDASALTHLPDLKDGEKVYRHIPD